MDDVRVIDAADFLGGEWPRGFFLVRTTCGAEVEPKHVCRGKHRDCGAFAQMRYSLGLPAGRKCQACWDASGYRKEGRSGFDPSYAGERYDEDY
jgi:hypothetical protein